MRVTQLQMGGLRWHSNPAFALLAAWFWTVAQARGAWVGFATNVVAHGVWNTTLITVWLVRNSV